MAARCEIFLHFEICIEFILINVLRFADDKVDELPESITDVGKISKGPLIFGLDPTNPQDWITVVLTGIIVYETFDLSVFWFQKLTGFHGFQNS